VEELDYTEALEWFGLQFAQAAENRPSGAWRLEIRADASAEQKGRLQKWLGRPAS
jgi:subtilisin-like proprotein convertase family protein